MNTAIKLEKMTTAEKIRTMEDLWDDLCRHAEDLPSPAWHLDLLEKRDRNILAGESKFEDWETAKKTIREKLP
jgi:hypothetical protein